MKKTTNYRTASKRQKRAMDNAARGPIATQCAHIAHKSAKDYTRKVKHRKSPLNGDFFYFLDIFAN